MTTAKEKQEPEFRRFLKQHQEECLNVVIWAAFGFKNYAERDAVALLKAYNERAFDNFRGVKV
jgi:hypothetical protein